MTSRTNVNTGRLGSTEASNAQGIRGSLRRECGNTADHQSKDNGARDLKDPDQVAVHDEICGKGSPTSKGVTKPSSMTACTISVTDTC
jgi:hypothetical protein